MIRDHLSHDFSRQKLYMNKEAYDKSCGKALALARQYNTRIWFGHDMAQVKELAALGMLE